MLRQAWQGDNMSGKPVDADLAPERRLATHLEVQLRGWKFLCWLEKVCWLTRPLPQRGHGPTGSQTSYNKIEI